MSPDDSSTRYIVFFNELPRFWSDVEAQAELLRQDGWKLMYNPGTNDVEHLKCLYDPAKAHTKPVTKREIEENPFRCWTHHETLLLFYRDGDTVGCPDGGWVGCPECGKG